MPQLLLFEECSSITHPYLHRAIVALLHLHELFFHIFHFQWALCGYSKPQITVWNHNTQLAGNTHTKSSLADRALYILNCTWWTFTLWMWKSIQCHFQLAEGKLITPPIPGYTLNKKRKSMCQVSHSPWQKHGKDIPSQLWLPSNCFYIF